MKVVISDVPCYDLLVSPSSTSCWGCCASYRQGCPLSVFPSRHPQHPPLPSDLLFLPQLLASWNPAAETPAAFSPVLWKTQ